MAETRTIRTVLELNAQRFNAGAASAAASAKTLASELGKISDAQGQHRADYDRVSNSLLGIGAAAATGLGLAAKASMDWESSWAGVLKTVDGTPKQLQAVEDGLRGLAKELPASHQEIAAVAEAAGQLGVETGSVVEFTETMINLGETTNLSAEEAATSLARFSNVMGTSQGDVDRLGATLVGLGNNFETTESEIIAMGMRLSGVGAQMGMTEGDVLGLATAMSSVGIEAEAGGTAMTLGMKKIDTAVREGGDSLAGFAEVAGMSNEEFAKLWSEDSTAGLEAFVHGLSRVGEEGGSVSGTLSELGITGIRESDTFLRLAANADGLSEALAQGNTEFERNLALTEEATKRYQTTESQLKLAKNAIVDAGIDIGASILPVLADVAGQVGDLAGAFGSLPSPVQDSIVQLGAIAGASALLAGGLMKVVPATMETIGAFKRIKTEAPGVASAMTKVGKAVGIATAAFTAVSLISAYGDSLTDFSIGANEAADAAMRLSDESNPFETVFEGMGEGLDIAGASAQDLAADLDILANGHWYEGISNMETGIRNAFGAGEATTNDLKQRLDEVGQGLAGLAQTDLPAAQESFKALWDAAGGTDEAGADLLDLMPALKDELTGMANAAGLATDDQTLLQIATGELVPVVDEATGAVTGYNTAQEGAEGATDDATGAVEEQIDVLGELQDVLQGTADALLGIRGSARDFEAAIDDANAAVEENGKTLDTTTEKGRANEAALDGIADAAHRYADAQAEAGASSEELDGIMSDGRQAFIDAAIDMGMSEEAAKDLADQMQLIPTFTQIEIEANTDAVVDGVTNAVQVAQSILDGDPATVPVDANTDQAEMQFDGLVSDVPPATMDVGANVTPAQSQVDGLAAAVDAAGGTITVNGNTVPASSSLSTIMGIINNSDGTVTIDGNKYPADQALGVAIAAINRSGGTVDIDGNNSGAIGSTDSAVGHANSSSGSIDVNANTASANSAINNAARTRTATINVRYSDPGFKGSGGSSGFANGGWVNQGLAAGGWVPGTYPGMGVDNIMWPMVAPGAANGRMLSQPLAGTEYVINGQSAQQWGPALEAINAGMQPAHLAPQAAVAPDLSGIAPAVAAGMRGMTVALNLDGRTLYGAVVDAGKSQRTPFVTRRG